MLIKQKSLLLSRNLHNKGKSAIPPLFNGPEVLSSASDKAKLFAKNFSKNSNIDDLGIALSVFPSRTDLKLKKLENNDCLLPREMWPCFCFLVWF